MTLGEQHYNNVVKFANNYARRDIGLPAYNELADRNTWEICANMNDDDPSKDKIRDLLLDGVMKTVEQRMNKSRRDGRTGGRGD